MMQSAFTQNIKPTQEQKDKIKEIFTPEYVIESSKPISIMKEQDSVIKVRDKQILALKEKIKTIQKEYTKTLVEIAKENKIAETTTNQVDSISDHQIKSERFKWKGLHLYGGVEVTKFEFQNSIINTELMYEFTSFEFGLRAEINPEPNQTESKYNFNYLLKVRYKFF